MHRKRSGLMDSGWVNLQRKAFTKWTNSRCEFQVLFYRISYFFIFYRFKKVTGEKETIKDVLTEFEDGKFLG